MHKEKLTDRALNRALLARQGLLERMASPLPEAVEAIGAVQAQYGPALPVALWSRVEGVGARTVHEALDRGELVVGTLLRRTLHLVTAREHAAYAAAVVAVGDDTWRRTGGEPTAEAERRRAELAEFAAQVARSPEEIADWLEEWVAARPDAVDPAELEFQRRYKWRPFRSTTALVRTPAQGGWSTKVPEALRAAPRPAGGPPEPAQALREVVRRHLRAFGPAGADDVAQWIGGKVTQVKAVLKELAPELAEFTDEGGRVLYDLPQAPRPHEGQPAPVRLLPWFDSTLLAYAPKRRARILPEEYKDAVYAKANLQLRPTFLVDGLVAGVWSLDVKRRQAVLTLTPLAKLSAPVRRQLVAEAERLLPVCAPEAAGHQVAFVD
ncbi:MULTISPECIES: winged helix DNA-binding domain-containing protein [Kitasatospora]|uniref:Winged helix DNA-binding domain-containing protein n=1 Tax=Kitasatospora cystarginea TaxID=58350 RepID=A0ABP5RQ62_9ACTN